MSLEQGVWNLHVTRDSSQRTPARAVFAFQSLSVVTCKGTKFYGISNNILKIIFNESREDNCEGGSRTAWGGNHLHAQRLIDSKLAGLRLKPRLVSTL